MTSLSIVYLSLKDEKKKMILYKWKFVDISDLITLFINNYTIQNIKIDIGWLARIQTVWIGLIAMNISWKK